MLSFSIRTRSEVTKGSNLFKNGPEDKMGPKEVPPAEKGPDDGSDHSQKVKIKRLIVPKMYLQERWVQVEVIFLIIL